MENLHEPVLVEEIKSFLLVSHINNQVRNRTRKIIDATVGTAGHTEVFLKAHASVLGIDQDEEMLSVARNRLERFQGELGDACPPFKLIHGNYIDISEIAKREDFGEVDAILFDLGVSTPQLTSQSRGFSFSEGEAPLDMRKDAATQGVTAADLLNSLREDQLMQLFSVCLPFSKAKRVTSEVLTHRTRRHFATVGDFLGVIGKAKVAPKGDLNRATLPFLALRIAVNSELDDLGKAIADAFGLLSSGGRLAVISFHSGEDRIVKSVFANLANAKIITKKPVLPSTEEITKNKKARSAKLRVIEKQ